MGVYCKLAIGIRANQRNIEFKQNCEPKTNDPLGFKVQAEYWESKTAGQKLLTSTSD